MERKPWWRGRGVRGFVVFDERGKRIPFQEELFRVRIIVLINAHLFGFPIWAQAQQQNTLVQGPKFKMVLHIRDFVVGGAGAGGAFDDYFNTEPVATVFGKLSLNNPAQAVVYAATVKGMLHGLRGSSNSEPPWHFKSNPPGREFIGGVWREGMLWGHFVASKEYRGFINMDRFTLLCDANGNLVNRNPNPTGNITDYTEAQLEWSHGFTKTPTGFKTGEPMTAPAASPINVAWIDNTIVGDECVVWKAQIYTRIANPARTAAFNTIGFDAPFVFIKAQYKLCCSGNYEIKRWVSHFPTASTYLNDVFQFEFRQEKLGEFLISGGPALNPAGTGNLPREVALVALTGTTPLRWPQPAGQQIYEFPDEVDEICQPLVCGMAYPDYDCLGDSPADGPVDDPIVKNAPSDIVACAGNMIDIENATPTDAVYPTFETCDGPPSNGHCCEGNTTPNRCPESCPKPIPPFCPESLSAEDCPGGIDPGPKEAVNCRGEGTSCTTDNECCFQGCNQGVCDATACSSTPIPIVSEWGLVVMTLLGLTIGTIALRRRGRGELPA